MRHSVSIVLGALSGAFVVTATPPLGLPAAQAQTNWREVRSLKMGRFRTRIEVSSARTVRLFSQLDTSRLTGPELSADSVRAWQKILSSELDKPTRTQYVLATAILVQPYAADSATIGFVLTVADTNGVSRTVVTDMNGIEEFFALLAKGATAATTLTDAELQRLGPVVKKPISRAKHVNFVHPRTARLAGQSVEFEPMTYSVLIVLISTMSTIGPTMCMPPRSLLTFSRDWTRNPST